MKAYELLFIIAPSTDEETRANTMNRGASVNSLTRSMV